MLMHCWASILFALSAVSCHDNGLSANGDDDVKEKGLSKIDFDFLINYEDGAILPRSLRQERSLKNGGEQQPQPKKQKVKKRENRKKIAISVVEKIIADRLDEHLEPLNAALRLVRFEALSEGVLRQLTSLEHIQSKLLTEFGELRAAVNEVGRHTLDLGRQVAGLDERLADLGRQLPHRMDLTANRGEFRSETGSRPSSSFVELPHQAEILKDALLTITSKISGTERRFKDDLMMLGNLTTETVRASQSFLERRITEVALDTERLLVTVEKLGNKSSSCPPSSPSFTSSITPSHTDRFFRRPSPLIPESSIHKLSSPEGARDDLIYLPAEERTSSASGGSRREERQHPPSITPFTGWVPPATEVQTFNLGTVSRLASQIAKHMINQGEFPGARDCLDIASKGERRSGVYIIYPASCSSRYAVRVWCELEESSGGWTVIQRRGPWGSPSSELSSGGEAPATSAPPVDFFRDWADYKWGFGDINDEYWLGNEYIYQLTQSGDYDLRIELHDWSAEMRWAEYSHFYIEDERHNYTLHIGEYTGNAGNSLKQHQGAAFSTKDRDNDANPRGHCARTFHGAWWFTSCHESHLNGLYHKGRHKSYGEGINWLAFRGHNYSLKMSRMMLKPAKKRA